MSFFFSFPWFSFKLRERERGYTKFGRRRNSPKGTYLISLMEFRGESFFFYGLIDFMLFLTLAWRTWVPHVRDVFLSSSTRSTDVGSSARYEPCPTTNFFIFYFRWRGGVPTSVLGSKPIVWLLPSSFVSGDPSEVTKYKHLWVSPLWPTFFLNGHSPMACHC